MNQQPKISVVMPVYNGEKYLHTAMKSILDQTFTDFEFLIMDDGSTDRTAQILESYGKKDRRIKVFQQKNKGIVKSLNTLIDQAQTDVIARMDVDDFSYPQRFEIQYQYLQQHPETVLIGSHGRIIQKRSPKNSRVNIGFEEDILNRWYLSIFPPFLHSAVIFSKKAFINAGGYWDDEYPAEDYGLWIRIKRFGKLSTVPEVLNDCFRNDDGVSAKNQAAQIKKRDELNLKNLEDLYKNNEIPSVKTALHLMQNYRLNKHEQLVLGKLACLTGCFLASKQKYPAASEYFRLCLKMDPRRFDAALNLLLQKFTKTFLVSIDPHPHKFKLFIKIHTFPRNL